MILQISATIGEGTGLGQGARSVGRAVSVTLGQCDARRGLEQLQDCSGSSAWLKLVGRRSRAESPCHPATLPPRSTNPDVQKSRGRRAGRRLGKSELAAWTPWLGELRHGDPALQVKEPPLKPEFQVSSGCTDSPAPGPLPATCVFPSLTFMHFHLRHFLKIIHSAIPPDPSLSAVPLAHSPPQGC